VPGWVIWAIVAAVLAVGELLTPGLFFLGPVALAYLTELTHRRPQIWIHDIERLHELLQTHGDAALRRAFERGLTEQAIGAEYIAHYLGDVSPGLPFDPKLVAYADFHEPSGVLAINQLLDARLSFTAVFASNDQTAYGARLALYQRNIKVPEEVSLIGFDDLPGSRYVIPPLSTIHQPVYELGQAAARVLLKLIEGGKSRVTLPEPQLVARESTRRIKA